MIAAAGPKKARHEQASSTIKRTTRIRVNTGVEQFGSSSSWAAAYRDMLSSTGILGKQIKWKKIELHVTESIIDMTRCYEGRLKPSEAQVAREINRASGSNIVLLFWLFCFNPHKSTFPYPS